MKEKERSERERESLVFLLFSSLSSFLSLLSLLSHCERVPIHEGGVDAHVSTDGLMAHVLPLLCSEGEREGREREGEREERIRQMERVGVRERGSDFADMKKKKEISRMREREREK